jgi:hypothetical protein
VEEVLVKVGQDLKPGTRILQFTGGCSHPTIMKVRRGRISSPVLQFRGGCSHTPYNKDKQEVIKNKTKQNLL